MSETRFTSTAILGSGSFGTAMAKLLAPKLDSILLIGRDPDTTVAINREHKNPHYLSDIPLGENVHASYQLEDALAHPLVIFAVPTSATRDTARKLAVAGLPAQTILLSQCYPGLTTRRKSPPAWPPAPSSAPKTMTSLSACRSSSRFPISAPTPATTSPASSSAQR
jgi:glycerol-3-phosphate dehydrogenase (NAD(P)+)